MQGRGCSSPLLELGVPTTTRSSGCRHGDVQHLRHRCSTLPKPAPSSTVHLFLQERIYFSRSWLLLQQLKRSGVCTTSRAQHRSTSPACVCVCVLGCHWCEGLQLCAKPPLCVVWVFARANSTGMLLWEHLLFPNKGLLSSKQAGVAGVC